jgi:hypothetical protein
MIKQIFLLFFFFSSFSFLTQAQEEKKYAYSLELGITHNAINFLWGNPYLPVLEDRDDYNYAVFPLMGFNLNVGYERKIWKGFRAYSKFGLQRTGYEGRHLDSFYVELFNPFNNREFIARDEKWTKYNVYSFTSTLGIGFHIKDKIFLKMGLLMQLPIISNEKTEQLMLHEFPVTPTNVKTANGFSSENTSRFNQLLTGLEFSVQFQIWKKFYFNLGYQALSENGRKNPYYIESERAPHFRSTLFAGLYVLNPFVR